MPSPVKIMPGPELREIAINQLVPSQAIISLGNPYDSPPLPPEVVLLEGHADEPEAKFMIADGHHRAHREYKAGAGTIWVYAHTEDQHLRSPRGAPGLANFRTLEEVRQKFYEVWDRRDIGVTSVSELRFSPWD